MNRELNIMESCRKVREFIDPYISNELPGSVRSEIDDHLAGCAECTTLVDGRRRVRTATRNAVGNEAVPEGLRVVVMELLHNQISQSKKRSVLHLFTGPNRNYGIAASFLVLLVGWSVFRLASGTDPGFPEGPVIVGTDEARARTVRVLDLGFGDHILCAVRSQHGEGGHDPGEMMRELGKEYEGLVPIIRTKLPDFQVAVAHFCSYKQREFIHMILRKGESVVSLAFTRKHGESLEQDSVVSVAAVNGLRLYEARLRDVKDYEVTGFETRGFLAFIITDQQADENLRIAQRIAGDVQAFLDKVPG